MRGRNHPPNRFRHPPPPRFLSPAAHFAIRHRPVYNAPVDGWLLCRRPPHLHGSSSSPLSCIAVIVLLTSRWTAYIRRRRHQSSRRRLRIACRRLIRRSSSSHPPPLHRPPPSAYLSSTASLDPRMLSEKSWCCSIAERTSNEQHKQFRRVGGAAARSPSRSARTATE